MTKKTSATDELRNDLAACVAELSYGEQERVDLLPDIVELLPPFVKTWTVKELTSAIMDR